jgi:hypothetical protein
MAASLINFIILQLVFVSSGYLLFDASLPTRLLPTVSNWYKEQGETFFRTCLSTCFIKRKRVYAHRKASAKERTTEKEETEEWQTRPKPLPE